jgi:COX assembly protein 1
MYYDKSSKVGYDETDKALNEELEEMLLRTPPHIQRKLQHRVHDALLHRMKEETARKCSVFLQRLDTCTSTRQSMHQFSDCQLFRDELNECAHEVNSEENYQKYRIMYLRGELLKFHEDRQRVRYETFKAKSPESIQFVKPWYGQKYAHQMQELGVEPQGNIRHDDLSKSEP